MRIAYVIYPDFTGLDLVGPYEVISRWPDAESTSSHAPRHRYEPTAVSPSSRRTPRRRCRIPISSWCPAARTRFRSWKTRSWSSGCAPRRPAAGGPPRCVPVPASTPQPDCSRAGPPRRIGASATTFARSGVEVVADRVVWQGSHISGAGVSAGIDMALALTERVHGREFAETLQLVIEYDPQAAIRQRVAGEGRRQHPAPRPPVLLGDRPIRMASRMNRQMVAARTSRARRALTSRRTRWHQALKRAT
jgi:hypothetical protein